MAELTTFIKIDRNIQEWRWYQDSNTFRVFFHLLLNANVKSKNFENYTIKRGQIAVGRKSLAEDLGLTEMQVRTALKHLKTTNEITIKTTSKFSIITINNYSKYQNVTNILTNKQPASNQRITNKQPQYKNDKNNKNVKNERERVRAHARETLTLGTFNNVFLAQDEYEYLATKYPSDYKQKIDRLSRYQEQKRKTYNNHYATLLDWLESDKSITEPRRSSFDIEELDKIR